ncbi:MAG: hypothetical protein GY715_05100 [Planctomycetes bacterium]|nr:hypothetical protein [Planctomycetota bacterium]
MEPAPANKSRLVVVLGGVVLVIVILLALAPTLIGATMGRSLVTNAVAKQVNGTPSVGSVSLSWFGSQRVEGLRVTEASGRDALDLDVTVRKGLLGLMGGIDGATLDVSGTINGTVNEDGTTSFNELASEAPAGSSSAPGGPPPSVTVNISDLLVALEFVDRETNETETLILDDINGSAALAPGGSVNVNLSTPTTVGSATGSMTITATATGVLDGQGAFSPDGAFVDATVDWSGSDVPVPFVAELESLRKLKVTANTDDLGNALKVGVETRGRLTGGSASRLDVNLDLDDPFDSAGEPNVGLHSISGTVTGVGVPTSLAAGALAGTPIDLPRDVGPTVDVTARFSPGTAGRVDVDASVDGANIAVEAKAVVAMDGAVDASRVDVTTTVKPALFRELTGSTVDAAVPLAVALTSLRLPAAPETGDYPVGRIGVEGSVTIAEPVVVTVAGDKPVRCAVASAVVGVRAATLGDEVAVDVNVLSGLADGAMGRLVGALVLRSPIGDDGSFALGLDGITGELTGTDVPTALVQLASVDLPIDFARDVGPTADIVAKFNPGRPRGAAMQGTDVEMTLTARHADVSATGFVDSDGAIEGGTLDATLNVQPALAMDLAGAEIDAPATVHAVVRSLSLPAPSESGISLADVTLDATVTASGPSRVSVGGKTIDMGRDVGPSLEVSAELARNRNIDLAVTSDRINVAGTGVVAESGAISGSGTVTAQLRPQLVRELAGITLDALVSLAAEIRSLGVSATKDLGALAVDATVALTGPIILTTGEGQTAARYTARDVSVDVNSDRLGREVHVTGSAAIESGRIEFDQRISGLLDDEGNFALAGFKPVGTVDVEGLTGDQVVALLPADQRSVVTRAVLAGDVGASIRTSASGNDLVADVSVQAGLADVSGNVRRTASGIRVQRGRVKLQVTSALLAALQEDSTDPVRLTSPANAIVTLSEFTLPANDEGAYDMPTDAVAFDVTVVGGAVVHSALSEPVALASLEASGTAQLGPTARYTLDGSAVVNRAGTGSRLANATYDIDVRMPEGGAPVPGGRVRLENLAVSDLEHVLGLDPETISGTVGSGGAVEIAIAEGAGQRRYTVDSELEKLTGTFTASLDDDLVEVTADELQLTLGRKTLEHMLAKAPEGAPARDRTLSVAADVPVTLALREATLPTALLKGEAFEPSDVRVDARVAGGPLVLVRTIPGETPAERRGLFGLPAGERQPATPPSEQRTTLERLDVTVRASDLRQGVSLTVLGSTRADGAEEPGAIDVQGTLTDVINSDSKLDVARGTLDLQATVTDVPTAVMDAMLRLNGKLAAALGPNMSGTFTADGFSTRAGSLDMNVTATNGWLRGKVLGEGGDLRTSAEQPVEAALAFSEPLRAEILAQIHPVLGDIQKTDRPIAFHVASAATVPVESGIEKLNAVLTIDVGKVEFVSAPNVVSIMSVYADATGPVRGEISPIVARAVNGVVTCEPFDVIINECRLTSLGNVDLVKRYVNARAETDLRCLSLALPGIREIREVADKLDYAVPVLIYGPFGNVKKEVDPKLIENLLATGIERAIKKELGGVLDDLFGGKKDK